MYEIFEQLLIQHGITAYRVAKDTGIISSTFSEWKKGTYTPKLEKLQKIADYFNVTVDYLMGTDKETASASAPLPGITDLDPKFISVIRKASDKGYTAEDIELALKVIDLVRK